jgi:hypothetical protein
MTLEELERRFWIEGKRVSRAVLLAFEYSWETAEDAKEQYHDDQPLEVDDLFRAPISWRPDL